MGWGVGPRPSGPMTGTLLSKARFDLPGLVGHFPRGVPVSTVYPSRRRKQHGKLIIANKEKSPGREAPVSFSQGLTEDPAKTQAFPSFSLPAPRVWAQLPHRSRWPPQLQASGPGKAKARGERGRAPPPRRLYLPGKGLSPADDVSRLIGQIIPCPLVFSVPRKQRGTSMPTRSSPRYLVTQPQ